MKIVSACLAGIKCRYDGTAKPNKKVIDLIKKGKAIPICPEQLGGLSTPRIPAETKNGRIVRKDGKDITAYFIKGAKEALKIAKMAGCKEAILKSKSPSCGVDYIYDGSFSGKLKKGDGIFTKLLKRNKIKCITAEEI
jgi:uncharacterized protein YbbK (DUF523 family)